MTASTRDIARFGLIAVLAFIVGIWALTHGASSWETVVVAFVACVATELRFVLELAEMTRRLEGIERSPALANEAWWAETEAAELDRQRRAADGL